MGKQLNIKSNEAYLLAEKLAAATGESLTDAVTKALAERLERMPTKSRWASEEERLAALERIKARAHVLKKKYPGATSTIRTCTARTACRYERGGLIGNHVDSA